MNEYLIKENKDLKELKYTLDEMNDLHAGTLVRHVKSGGVYRISHFSVLNHNGISELAVNYHPFIEDRGYDITSVRHTRSCQEFFDGRFEGQF